MCDYEVAMSRIRYLHEQGMYDDDGIVKAAKLVAIPSQSIAIAFAAFGLETWLNLIAAAVLKSKTKVTEWDKNSAATKYSKLLETLELGGPSADLQSRISRLFSYRRQVVHDKSRVLCASEGVRDFRKEWDDSLEPIECLQTLVSVEEDFASRAPELPVIVGMKTIDARDAKSWIDSPRLRVGSTLPFFGGEFPNLHQYRRFYRRRLETDCPPVLIDPASGFLERA